MPQGSVLGLILFILYTNNIPGTIKNVSPDITVALCADDTQTVDQFSKSELQDEFRKTGENISHTKQSYGRIGLKLNPSKTQCMLCGSMPAVAQICGGYDPMLHVQGQSLPLNSVVNDLGILLDDRMTFTAHADSLVKMTGVMSSLSIIRRFLTEDATKELLMFLDATKLLVH